MNLLTTVIQHLNHKKIRQSGIDWMDDLTKKDYETYFKGKQAVLEEANSDKHGWYETADSVYPLLGGFIGVNSVWTIYSESMDVSDAAHTLEFFEMKEIKKISYVKI